ncbi:DUF1284 domain-containing protein [Halocynthiibacter namhaensis]|uniref:DUF1284 domain-containing protein n=1 Tax=Halocynthiibacter namhaensis TaxID=1290553 RepID=UPI00068D2049|nr:DUF1284 domain-containing protein [Halocynthiibacter namhaensis]
MSAQNSSKNFPRSFSKTPGEAALKFRPHHFLCSLGFQGKGYSDEFTANMTRIVDQGLRAPKGEATDIVVVRNTDDICAPCPKRRGLRCSNQDGIEKLDKAHLRALGLSYNERLTWGDALDLIKQRISPGGLQIICAGCQWLEYGMCETAVQKLHTERAPSPPEDFEGP